MGYFRLIAAHFHTLYSVNKNENGEVLVESIYACKKEKLIKYIEENGLPVINIFKSLAIEGEDCLSEGQEESTPRFQECIDITKISYKEVVK